MTVGDARPAGPLVVDANVLFSALLRDGTTRHVILYGDFDLHAPEHLFDELTRNRAYLVAKSGATEGAFDLLLDAMRDRIRVIPTEVIRPHVAGAIAALGKKDELDAPYVAAALAIRGGLWTQDKRLAKKARIPVFTTADLVEASRRA